MLASVIDNFTVSNSILTFDDYSWNFNDEHDDVYGDYEQVTVHHQHFLFGSETLPFNVSKINDVENFCHFAQCFGKLSPCCRLPAKATMANDKQWTKHFFFRFSRSKKSIKLYSSINFPNQVERFIIQILQHFKPISSSSNTLTVIFSVNIIITKQLQTDCNWLIQLEFNVCEVQSF